MLRKEQIKVSSSVQSWVVSLVVLMETRGSLLHIQTQIPAGKTPRKHFHSHKLGCFLHFAAEGEDNWEGLTLIFLTRSPSTPRSAESWRNENYCAQISKTPTPLHPAQQDWENPKLCIQRSELGVRDRHSFTAKEEKDLWIFLNHSFLKTVSKGSGSRL